MSQVTTAGVGDVCSFAQLHLDERHADGTWQRFDDDFDKSKAFKPANLLAMVCISLTVII